VIQCGCFRLCALPFPAAPTAEHCDIMQGHTEQFGQLLIGQRGKKLIDVAIVYGFRGRHDAAIVSLTTEPCVVDHVSVAKHNHASC
tara:strand:+ start:129 stop:386 length:258 start_codon:yes stop_codon:yes gene_type:complete